jgi:hypothetical protein
VARAVFTRIIPRSRQSCYKPCECQVAEAREVTFGCVNPAISSGQTIYNRPEDRREGRIAGLYSMLSSIVVEITEQVMDLGVSVFRPNCADHGMPRAKSRHLQQAFTQNILQR